MASEVTRFTARRRFHLVAAVGLLLAAPAWADLQIGDPAPPLTVSDWIKGDPVDIAKGKGKNIFVLEFWATWCGPCLPMIPLATELQKRYRDQGVVVVGVTSAGQFPQYQTKEAVRMFVERQGKKMDYAVAFDGKNTVNALYMQALGAMGIPYAVVVDKTGHIAWTGHPAGGMEQAIEEMLSPDYDPQLVYQRRRADSIFQQAVPFIQRAMWAQALPKLEEVLEADRAHQSALTYMVYIRSIELPDPEGLATWVEAYLADGKGEVEGLAYLADALMGVSVIEARQPELTLRVARAAYDAGRGSNALAISIYARAVFGIGLVDEAIELQAQGLRLAEKSDKPRFRSVLDYFESCKKLQEAGI